MESGGINPLILNFGTRWKLEVSYMVRLLYLQHPLNKRLHGTQSLSGCFGEEKNFFHVPGFKH
jgi:hypothetical protein